MVIKMKENNELLEHIYQDAEMAYYTLEKLEDFLKEKDNKIKGLIEEIKEEYQEFMQQAESRLEKDKQEIIPEDMMTKWMAKMGIKKEVKSDNSDSSIADLLIKGISMGSINMEKKIKDYEKTCNKEDLKLAKKFLEFQEDTIEELKEYL
jgi:hypothetical protein